MKKQLILSTIFSLALLFTACQSEDENLKSPINEKGKITFSLPAPSGSVSYATVAATADENLLNKLDIYMFNEAEVLENVYSAVTANGSGASRTATIDVTGKSGAKTFYFAVNTEAQSTELDNIVVGTTSLDEFKEIVTNKQTALIKASDGLLMSAVKTITDVTAELSVADKTVNLRRRVARFDVMNDASVTNFTINKIMVSKANLRTYLFEDATGTPTKTIEADKLPVVDFNTTDFPNANTATAAAGAFYMYPTALEAGKTEISIEGEFNGVTQVYSVALPAATPIKANYRYILKAKKMDIANIEWEIAIDEWEDGSEVESGPASPLFTLSGLSRTGGTGGLWDANAKTYDITAATTASTISFRTSSINKAGTTATVVYKHDTNHSSMPGFTVTTPQPVLTYGASYTQDYKINIPVQTKKIPIRIEITIWDVVSPVRKEVIVIHSSTNYQGTGYAPVLFKGIYWAPVNVGATEIDATVLNEASMGRVYQWGRNNSGWVTKSTNTFHGDEIAGPFTLAEAANATNKDKFIKTSTSPHNWVKIDASYTQAMADALWTGANAQAVCPDGWRLPTDVELRTISAAYTTDKFSAVTHRLAIPGDNAGETLYLPAAGQRIHDGGTSSQGTYGYYWSSGITGINAYYLYFNTSFGYTSSLERVYARSVRCVLDN